MRATVMKISEKALYQNACAIRRRIPEGVKMMCVVKADAYGHDAVNAAQAMLRAGADAFAVAIVEEAVQLRASGITQPILILGGGGEDSLREAVACGASQAVYMPWMLDVLQDQALKLGKNAKAHLKIDSGMSRIGVRGGDDLAAMIEKWKACPNVEMEGIFTHFCAAEDDPEFTVEQNRCFAAALDMVRRAGFAPISHAAATSAMLDGEFQHDMVRAGIGLYGCCLPQIQEKLACAQTLITKPVRIQRILSGETVGYGRTATAQRESVIMTIPIGYGDGYPRILSNRACALVEGRRAPIIGNVCMDMIMLDVTGIPGAGPDSEVVLLGAQGEERITPDELADLAGTIPYEIMLGFSSRVRRVCSYVRQKQRLWLKGGLRVPPISTS